MTNTIETYESEGNVMKRCYKLGFFLFLVLGLAHTAHAANPAFGWHGDNSGDGELVLDYDHAKELANSLSGSPSDPIISRSMTGLVNFAALYGSRIVPAASLVYNVTNLVMAADRYQMRNATAVPNYEAYGFRMKRWVPYWCNTYSFNDGTLLREDGSPTVYAIVADAKFWVPNGSYFNYQWSRIKVVPRGRLSGWYKYPKAGALLREQNNPAVNYIMYSTVNPQYTWVNSTNQQGWVRRVMSYNAFVRYGFSWSNVKVVPDGAFSSPNPYLPRGFDLL